MGLLFTVGARLRVELGGSVGDVEDPVGRLRVKEFWWKVELSTGSVERSSD